MKYLSVLGLSLFSMAAGAQTITWQTAQSVAPSSAGNAHPHIVLAANGNPVILWGKDANASVNFSRWAGSAFSAPVRLSPTAAQVFTASWAGPDIAAKGDTIYVVYKAEPEDTAGIYLLKSTNGGVTFGMPVRVDNIGMNSSRFPTISTDNAGQPIVGFMKFNSGFTSARWVVAKSMNWGSSFMADVLASSYNSEPVCDCCPGTVVSAGNTIAMLYRNNRNDKRTIWTGVSTNGGTTYPTGMEVDNTGWTVNACPSSGPDGAIIGDTLYTAFMSGAGGAKVYYSKSTLSAMQSYFAMPVTGASTGITGQNYPRMANDGNAVAIVWPQTENNLPQVAMLFAANVQNGFPTWQKVVTNASGDYISNADVAVKNGTVHVVWEDVASGTVMYRKGAFSSTSIKEVKGGNALVLAPMPSNNELQVTLQQAETKPCTLTIIDLAGRISFQREYPSISGTITVSTSDLPSGIYVIKLVTADGFTAKQFVVSH